MEEKELKGIRKELQSLRRGLDRLGKNITSLLYLAMSVNDEDEEESEVKEKLKEAPKIKVPNKLKPKLPKNVDDKFRSYVK